LISDWVVVNRQNRSKHGRSQCRRSTVNADANERTCELITLRKRTAKREHLRTRRARIGCEELEVKEPVLQARAACLSLAPYLHSARLLTI
jgi:hypothetical protein